MTTPLDISTIFQTLTEYAGEQLFSADARDEATEAFERLFEAIDDRDGLDCHDLVRDESYWTTIRSQWAFAEQSRVTPINASNLCPAPAAVICGIHAIRRDLNRNVGLQRRTAPTPDRPGYFVRHFDLARSAIARSLNCSTDDFAIIRNASEGNNLISSATSRRAQPSTAMPSVVLWCDNHPTNLGAWEMHSKIGGTQAYEIRRVAKRPDAELEPPHTPERLAEVIAQAFIDKIDGTTRVVSFNATSAINGMRIPFAAMRRIYLHIENHYPDCHLHVDGAQTWGAHAVDLTSEPFCHSFTASAHKWFCGPKETGILWMDRRKIENFPPPIYAYDYKVSLPKNGWRGLPMNARRFEYIGQRDDANVIELRCAQLIHDAINARDPERDLIGKRTAYLADRLIGRLAPRWSFVSPHRPDQATIRHGVVRVEAPRHLSSSNTSLYDYIYRAGHIAGAGGKINGVETLRLSPHFYNLDSDLERAATVMNAWRDRG